MNTIFVSGIGTNIGKTVVSAILTEALQADYWKPVQSGDLHYSDTHKVKALVTNKKTVFHPERHRLQQPLSPHASAKIDGVEINLSDFSLPKTNNHLIIEGAGGLMVPLNEKGDLIVDLIQHLNVCVVLVSQNYLGSINHTLLSIQELKRRNINIVGLVFNGDSTPETEQFIQNYTGIPILARIKQEKVLEPKTIVNYAKSIQL